MHPLLRADLTFDEVVNPTIRWCKSGHSIPEKMKVYSVQGATLNKMYWGHYCDACVRGAHLLANAKKMEKEAPTEPEVAPKSPGALKSELRRVGFVGGLVEEENENNPKEEWETFVEDQR